MTNELLTARFNENDDQLELADMHLYDKIIKERNHNLVTTTLRFTKNEHDNMKHAKESRICSTLFCKRGNADANAVPFAEMSVEQRRERIKYLWFRAKCIVNAYMFILLLKKY